MDDPDEAQKSAAEEELTRGLVAYFRGLRKRIVEEMRNRGINA